MPNRCVVYGCSNTSNTCEGIALHAIPFRNDDRPETKKRRKVWVNFMKQKRTKWEPSSHFVICSKHFKAEDFEQQYTVLPGQEIKTVVSHLKRDETGICVHPVIHSEYKKEASTISARDLHCTVRVTIYIFSNELIIYFYFLFVCFFYPLRCTVLNIVRLKHYHHRIFLKRLSRQKFQ